MKQFIKNMPKWLKVILIILVVLAAAYVLLIFAIAIFLVTTLSDHTDLYGDIHLVSDYHTVGEPVAMIFEAPEELEGIHRLMWDVKLIAKDGKIESYETPKDLKLYQGERLLELYDEATLKMLFQRDSLDLENWAILLASKVGEYEVSLAGFYKQTNPQGITLIRLKIEE